MSMWMTMDKGELDESKMMSPKKDALLSSESCAGYQTTLTRDGLAINEGGDIIYMERGSGSKLQALKHGGSDVYIRMALKDAPKDKYAGRFDPTPVQVNYIGHNPNRKLDIGEGDCDRDSDCKEGLKCGQRNGFEQLPGLTGFEKMEVKGKEPEGNGDYCYDPDYYNKAAQSDP